jgi:Flp pilus assembly protein TadG
MAGGVARRRRGRADERGAAAVEFALVVPVLLLLLFGIISYGYMLSFRQAISQAAAEGARAAAVTLAGTSDAQRSALARTAVEEALDSYGVDCTGAMTCTINAADTCGSATCVSVELDYNWGDEPLVPGLPGLGLVTPDHLVYRAVAQVS